MLCTGRSLKIYLFLRERERDVRWKCGDFLDFFEIFCLAIAKNGQIFVEIEYVMFV